MKKIVIAYWSTHDLISHFKHNCEFVYTIEKQCEIIQIIIEHGLTAMVRPNMGAYEDTLLIYIGEGKFI